jgi:hypothetical protein
MKKKKRISIHTRIHHKVCSHLHVTATDERKKNIWVCYFDFCKKKSKKRKTKWKFKCIHFQNKWTTMARNSILYVSLVINSKNYRCCLTYTLGRWKIKFFFLSIAFYQSSVFKTLIFKWYLSLIWTQWWIV